MWQGIRWKIDFGLRLSSCFYATVSWGCCCGMSLTVLRLISDSFLMTFLDEKIRGMESILFIHLWKPDIPLKLFGDGMEFVYVGVQSESLASVIRYYVYPRLKEHTCVRTYIILKTSFRIVWLIIVYKVIIKKSIILKWNLMFSLLVWLTPLCVWSVRDEKRTRIKVCL